MTQFKSSQKVGNKVRERGAARGIHGNLEL
jgi:hypothetical protein